MKNSARRLRSALLWTALALLAATAIAGCHHADPLVGKWQGSLPGGGQASAQYDLVFNADGTETQTFTGPGQNITIQARYTTKDNTLTSTYVSATHNGQIMGGGATTTLNYTLDGDTLTLSQAGQPQPLILHRQNN